ncbi:MAG: glycosyltransferase [Leptospirales bacterium]|nr:glycosyltransferase [Leptospirales bacterium]
MNIVIFTDTYLPKIDGVGISVSNFSRLLAARGHHVTICAPEYEATESISPPSGVEILRFKNAPLPSYPEIKVVLPSQKKIRKAMTEPRADLIHIQSPGLLGQYGVLAARMYGVPLIGTYHTLVSEQETYVSLYRLLKVDTLLNYFTSNKKVKKRLDKVERKEAKSLKKRIIMNLVNRMYDQCELVISPSHLIREELIESGLRKPVEVVSNGMDLTKFRGSVKDRPASPPRFLHVGRISYEKNCEVVLKAFALVREKIPDATLDIVGDGPAITSLKIEANHLDIAGHVRFHGFVKHEDLPDLYPQYDVQITASTMETQGLVVLESMACGLPCIGVDAFALPELIHDNRNGFIVEPFDHIRMAERAIELVSDAAMFRRFSERSLEIASEHEINKCADKLETVYRLVAERKLHA